MTAPTEAEIRDSSSRPLPEALWGDLRPSEAIALMARVREACDRAAERCAAIMLDELTAAGAAFAAQHPGASRAKVAA